MIGDLLVELRKDRNMTQADVAKALGITAGTISNYECERNDPTLHMLRLLCNFYNVSSDYLLGLSRVKLNAAALGVRIGNKSKLSDCMFMLEHLPYDDQCFVERMLYLLQDEKANTRGE